MDGKLILYNGRLIIRFDIDKSKNYYAQIAIGADACDWECKNASGYSSKQLIPNLTDNSFTNGFVRVAWLTNKTVDADGHINIGDDSMYKYVLSVGIGSSIDPAIYVSKIFKNKYGMWYVKISQNNGADYTNTAGGLNLGVIYLTV